MNDNNTNNEETIEEVAKEKESAQDENVIQDEKVEQEEKDLHD